MATQVGELFVRLGIDGQDKTAKGISDVSGKMKELGSVSWEAKVAIVGALYGLQRFFSATGQMGTDLTNFNALLGEGSQTLQQYQYALRQAGVSNDETAATFKNIQSQMAKTKLGRGAPEGLGRVAHFTGGNITTQDVDKYMEKPELFLLRTQEYVKNALAAGEKLGVINETLSTFGFSDTLKAALLRQSIQPNVLNKAPTLSEGQVGALDKSRAAWSNLGNSIDLAFARFNAAHGKELATDFAKLIGPVEHLTKAFMTLATSAHAFQGLTAVFEGWAIIFQGIASVIDTIIANFDTISSIGSGLEQGFVRATSGDEDTAFETEFNKPTKTQEKATRASEVKAATNIFKTNFSPAARAETKQAGAQLSKFIPSPAPEFSNTGNVPLQSLLPKVPSAAGAPVAGAPATATPPTPDFGGEEYHPSVFDSIVHPPSIETANKVASTPTVNTTNNVTNNNNFNTTSNVTVNSTKVDDKQLADVVAKHTRKHLTGEINKAARQLPAVRTGG